MLSRIIFFFFDYKKSQKLKSFASLLYSSWIKNEFYICGDNFNVKKIDIKGGEYISIGSNFSGISNLRFECWDKFQKQIFKPR